MQAIVIWTIMISICTINIHQLSVMNSYNLQACEMGNYEHNNIGKHDIQKKGYMWNAWCEEVTKVTA